MKWSQNLPYFYKKSQEFHLRQRYFFKNKYQEFVRLLLNTKESLYVKKEKEKENRLIYLTIGEHKREFVLPKNMNIYVKKGLKDHFTKLWVSPSFFLKYLLQYYVKA